MQEERTKETGGYHPAGILQEGCSRDAARKTTLQSLQKSIDTIIFEQSVSMHLDHPHNGQYGQPEEGVYHRQGLGCVSTWLRYTFSFSVV